MTASARETIHGKEYEGDAVFFGKMPLKAEPDKLLAKLVCRHQEKPRSMDMYVENRREYSLNIINFGNGKLYNGDDMTPLELPCVLVAGRHHLLAVEQTSAPK